MNKYRVRKLVNGTFRIDVKHLVEFAIPLTLWKVTLPIWNWSEWPTAYRTAAEAEAFIQKMAEIDAGNETLDNETRYYTHKGEHIVDSYM